MATKVLSFQQEIAWDNTENKVAGIVSKFAAEVLNVPSDVARAQRVKQLCPDRTQSPHKAATFGTFQDRSKNESLQDTTPAMIVSTLSARGTVWPYCNSSAKPLKTDPTPFIHIEGSAASSENLSSIMDLSNSVKVEKRTGRAKPYSRASLTKQDGRIMAGKACYNSLDYERSVREDGDGENNNRFAIEEDSISVETDKGK